MVSQGLNSAHGLKSWIPDHFLYRFGLVPIIVLEAVEKYEISISRNTSI